MFENQTPENVEAQNYVFLAESLRELKTLGVCELLVSHWVSFPGVKQKIYPEAEN